MKVIAFNGSPRKEGNTNSLINMVFEELHKESIETEIYQFQGKKIRGCIACMQCMKNQDKRCGNTNDVVNECIEKIQSADGVIFGSPTYFGNVTAELKALIDRAGLVSMVNGQMFARKVGAAVVAVRRAGGVETFNSINNFFFLNQMIIPGSSYWNIAYGYKPKEVENDEEGKMTIKNLGANMAWLLKKLE